MWKKKEWSEMTVIQKVGVVLLGTLQVTLLAAALWDIRNRPEEEIRGNKWVWTAVVFVNFVGPIAYFMLGRSSGRGNRILLADEEIG
jgi:hypothetical protein